MLLHGPLATERTQTITKVYLENEQERMRMVSEAAVSFLVRHYIVIVQCNASNQTASLLSVLKR